MIDLEDECWAFVVDTDQYAGNFERQLCAYCTGMVGECGVGAEYCELWVNEELDLDRSLNGHFFWQIAREIPDENGFRRPVSIYPSPDDRDSFNSVAFFFSEKPSRRHIEIMARRAREFSQRKFDFDEFKTDFEVRGFRLLRQYSVVEEVPL